MISSSWPGLSSILSSPGRRVSCEATERRDPVIHDAFPLSPGCMDCRVKPGNDNVFVAGMTEEIA
jgi:hypothetical protein